MLTCRSLAPADLDVLVEGPRRPGPAQHGPQTLRDVHHQMARLFAMGLRTGQVAERIGYTLNRVSTIRNSPAFEALVQGYREKLDAAFTTASFDYFATLSENGRRAERLIADRLGALIDGDEDATPISTKELITISRDSADRIGYGKRQTNLNLNADFATLLDRAVRRSRDAQREVESPDPKMIDVTPPLARRA